VDYFSAMAAPDHSLPAALRVDDKHPNAAGYRVMDRVLEQALDGQS
jgi:lysophospholipase L1-like esterase